MSDVLVTWCNIVYVVISSALAGVGPVITGRILIRIRSCTIGIISSLVAMIRIVPAGH